MYIQVVTGARQPGTNNTIFTLHGKPNEIRNGHYYNQKLVLNRLLKPNWLDLEKMNLLVATSPRFEAD